MIYIPAMATFGERLAWARKQKQLSQSDLAERAGVALSSIANAEAGTRHSIRKIASVAAILDVDVKWLSEGEGAADSHKRHLRLVEDKSLLNWVRVSSRELALLTTYRETDETSRQLIDAAAQAAENAIASAALRNQT